jgi:hypothetical protein
MRNNTFKVALVLAAVIAPAHADEKAPQAFDAGKAWQQMQQQLLRQFDANRDGKLTGQEQLLAQEAMRRQGANLGIPPGGFAGAEQFNKQFDRDGDGKLSQTEKMAAQAAYQRLLNAGKSGAGGGVARGRVPQPPLLVPQVDQKPDKVPPLIKRFDKDGDGKLNDAEKATAQAELKKSKPKDGKAADAKTESKDKDAKPEPKDKDAAGK